MPARANQWRHKIVFPLTASAPLDFGQELWVWDISRYESADAVRDARARASLSTDDDAVLADATRDLILDVVDAAAGVEWTFESLKRSMREAQDEYDLYIKDVPAAGGHGGWGDLHHVEDATYALEAMLAWSRSMKDRLRRPAVKRGYRADQGLIPALADGPRKQAIVAAKDRLLRDGVAEADNLSNLNLHMQPYRSGSRSARVEAGCLLLPFPDPTTTKVDHRFQLTYNDKRDGVSFADTLMTAVERFVNDMIAALAANIPARFTTP